MALTFTTTPNAQPASDARRAEILANPGFGQSFTDHMLQATWTPEQGWHDGRIDAYGPITLMPSAAVLHYAQEVFEGLKAYRHEDGSVWGFRPEANAARLQRSCRRLALPEMSEEDFLGALTALVEVDQAWVPVADGTEKSLYLRPFMYASEAFLGVRPARTVTFSIIASPAGAYFSGGLKPVTLWISEHYARAGVGGTGSAKCGGNYASSLAGQLEGIEHGCDQAVFLDSATQTWPRSWDWTRKRSGSRSRSGSRAWLPARSGRSSPAAPPPSSPRWGSCAGRAARPRRPRGRAVVPSPTPSAPGCWIFSTAARRTLTAGCAAWPDIGA